MMPFLSGGMEEYVAFEIENVPKKDPPAETFREITTNVTASKRSADGPWFKTEKIVGEPY